MILKVSDSQQKKHFKPE